MTYIFKDKNGREYGVEDQFVRKEEKQRPTAVEVMKNYFTNDDFYKSSIHTRAIELVSRLRRNNYTIVDGDSDLYVVNSASNWVFVPRVVVTAAREASLAYEIRVQDHNELTNRQKFLEEALAELKKTLDEWDTNKLQHC